MAQIGKISISQHARGAGALEQELGGFVGWAEKSENKEPPNSSLLNQIGAPQILSNVNRPLVLWVIYMTFYCTPAFFPLRGKNQFMKEF